MAVTTEGAGRVVEACDSAGIRLGVFYRDETRARYDLLRRVSPKTTSERLALLEAEFDKHAV